MVTIISGTNRIGSRTLQVANHYLSMFQTYNADVHLVSLVGLNVVEKSTDLLAIQEKYLVPSEKFVFVMPEYNGSFPGILKTMLDNTDIRRCWWHKKALLTGVADGRGGNLRGIEHMTNILHYLKMNVHYNKLPLSKINDEMDAEGRFIHQHTIDAIATQINVFLSY